MNLDEKLAQGAILLGLIQVIGDAVVPADESQVADSTGAEAMPDAPVQVDEAPQPEDSFSAEEDTEEGVKTAKSTRTKSQASKES